MNKKINDIQLCIEDYFRGTHEGDIARIQKAFHPDCKITGFYNTRTKLGERHFNIFFINEASDFPR